MKKMGFIEDEGEEEGDEEEAEIKLSAEPAAPEVQNNLETNKPL